MKRVFILSFITVVVSSCLRLDSNLYNPEKVSEYTLDDYEGEVEVDFSNEEKARYELNYDSVHLFTLNSIGADDNDATEIWAMYIGDMNTISTDTVIMYCHGNARNMDAYYQRAKLLANVGQKYRFGVMMIDYRGYGMSEGYSTEEGLYTDVNTALKWLEEKGLNSDRLIIYGYSLGSAPATELTANPRALTPSKLILEAPFASAEVMVQDAGLLAAPGTFYTDLKIDNAEEIKKVKVPFMWWHGTEDHFLAIKTHGEIVAKNYGGNDKTEIRVEGAVHTDVPHVYGYDNYLKELEKFIEK